MTGQAIRPKRRGKGGPGSSLTAPSTPVRGVLGRSRSVEQGRGQGQARSMEVSSALSDTLGNQVDIISTAKIGSFFWAFFCKVGRGLDICNNVSHQFTLIKEVLLSHQKYYKMQNMREVSVLVPSVQCGT